MVRLPQKGLASLTARKWRSCLWTALVLAGSSLGWGCSSSTDTQLALRGNVQVSFSTQAPPGLTPSPVLAVAAVSDTIAQGSDTLILTKAQLVLRKIELKRVDVGTCAGQPTDCDEIELGPALIDLPLVAGARAVFSDTVPVGTYQRIDFEVHKVSKDAPEDAAIRLAHPEFVERSIRVEGTFNRRAFVYESDLDVEQELKLSPPLEVGSRTGVVNLTIRVTLATWFRSQAGGLLDPITGNKGGPNESVIKNNIQQSMKAFEDRDGDGDERDG